MAKTPDPKNLLTVFSKSDNTVNFRDFVFDRRRKQSNNKYYDFITSLSVIINCIQAKARWNKFCVSCFPTDPSKEGRP